MTQNSTANIFDIIEISTPINIVDIGASLIGDEAPYYQALIDSGHARLFAFEPDEAALAVLRERFPAPHVCFPHFVADGNDAIFHETSWYATGSLFEPNMPLLERFNDLAELTRLLARHPVKTVRLDDLDAVRDIDFLKVDAQGAELMIFENALRVLNETSIVQTEVSWVEMYKGMPTIGDIDRMLRAADFQWHTRLGGGGRAFRPWLNPNTSQNGFQQELWNDVVYVRNWMQFARVTPDKLTKLAVVLHELYGSYDLAHVALAAADTQSGSDRAQRYGEWLYDLGAVVPPPRQRVQSSPKKRPPFIEVCNDKGLKFSVPGAVECISSYVLLEQTRWFEKQIDFIYRFAEPGMIALDIGANVGAYALPLAKLVGPHGKLIAYEPSKENREHLVRAHALNQLGNIEVAHFALSNFCGYGLLQLNESGELHQMVRAQGNAKHTEAIEVSTLNIEAEKHQWPHVDFIKLDAEGQEGAILEGATDFLDSYSPLVMFEINHGSANNLELVNAFRALGFGIYRLLGDASLLVPVNNDETIDIYELNVFAARPAQAESLAARGLLARERDGGTLTISERRSALAAYCNTGVAKTLEVSPGDVEQCPFGEALIAYSAYRYVESISADQRVTQLGQAFKMMLHYCESSNSPAGLVTLARIASDFGQREISVEVLNHLLKTGATEIDQPFLPPTLHCESLDHVPVEEWFIQGAREAIELQNNFSTFFARDMRWLDLLVKSRWASPPIIRRRILVGLSEGQTLDQMAGLIDRLQDMSSPEFNVWREALGKLAATI
jgi:FkbM family methyltransferase